VLARLQRHFATDEGWEALSALQLRGKCIVLRLDFASLRGQTGSSDLDAAMQYQPSEAIACIAAAVYEVSSASPRLRGAC